LSQPYYESKARNYSPRRLQEFYSEFQTEPISRVVRFMRRPTSTIDLYCRIESNKDTFGLFLENELGAKSYTNE